MLVNNFNPHLPSVDLPIHTFYSTKVANLITAFVTFYWFPNFFHLKNESPNFQKVVAAPPYSSGALIVLFLVCNTSVYAKIRIII